MPNLLAEHFDFDIVVHRLRCRTGRIAAHVASLRHLAVNRTPVVALAVFLVGALAELGGVVMVVVEDGEPARLSTIASKATAAASYAIGAL